MERVTTVPLDDGVYQSRVVLTLRDGEQIEATSNGSHGHPTDPLTQEEIVAKFDECAAGTASEAQRAQVVDLCARLETLADVGELTDAIGAAG